MSFYNCILLTDSQEKIEFLNDFFKSERTTKVVYSSCEDEDPEELNILYHPDIVIMDIEREHRQILKLVNGFTLMASDVRVIVFTDYTRFSFNTSIDRLENVNFLPRPVSHISLGECLAQIKGELSFVRERDFSQTSLQGFLNDYFPTIRQHYLSMLLRQPMPETENVLQKFKTLRIDCPGPNYTVIVADILSDGRQVDNFEAINFLLNTNIKSAIVARGYQCYIFFDSDFRINGLVGSERDQMEDDLEVILTDVKNHFDKMSNFRLVAGIGRTVDSPTEINKSYNEGEIALEFAIEAEGIALFKNISSDRKKENLLESAIKKILQLYSANKTEECQREIAEKISELKQEQDLDGVKRFVVKYIIKAVNSSAQWKMNLLNYPIIPYILSRIYAATDFQTVEECEQEFTGLLFSFWQDYKSHEDRLVEQAMSFIGGNIANPSLDLEMVSSSIGISKSYLCRLFHRVTNQKFSNFIRLLRVEKAKVLLAQSNLKTYEVAEASGFTSSKYFASVFKQVTGLTPNEYQKSSSDKGLR